MAIRGMRFFGDDVLAKKTRKIEVFDKRLAALLDDLFDTLATQDGVGLAAPQVGILRRVAVVAMDGNKYELVNPEIVFTNGTQEGLEGCLSCPGKYGIVERPMDVRVRAQDRTGTFQEYEGSGLLARAFCHETDHLDGVVFTALASRILTDEELAKYTQQDQDQNEVE